MILLLAPMHYLWMLVALLLFAGRAHSMLFIKNDFEHVQPYLQLGLRYLALPELPSDQFKPYYGRVLRLGGSYECPTLHASRFYRWGADVFWDKSADGGGIKGGHGSLLYWHMGLNHDYIQGILKPFVGVAYHTQRLRGALTGDQTEDTWALPIGIFYEGIFRQSPVKVGVHTHLEIASRLRSKISPHTLLIYHHGYQLRFEAQTKGSSGQWSLYYSYRHSALGIATALTPYQRRACKTHEYGLAWGIDIPVEERWSPKRIADFFPAPHPRSK